MVEGRATKPLVGALIVTGVTSLGAIWYWLVEGFSAIDGLYQSVITVSTVGFGEVQPLDDSGRLFTVVLIVIGVASVVYALGGFAELLIDSSIRRVTFRRKERTLERMTGHTIVCGYGRFGAAVAARLPEGSEVGVIERSAERVEVATEAGLVAIEGDSTLDETLVAAGIDRASKLIVCLSNDSDAISTVLSARVLSPETRVVTRVSDPSSAKKLRLAGADHVVSPIEMGAQRLVADAMEPSIGWFLDAALHDETVGLSIRALVVGDVPQDLDRRELESESGVRIVGVHDLDGTVRTFNESESRVQAGQRLLAVGHRDELATLEALVAG